ncbi:hypothetical protein [Rugosimonospora africana]|uniref:DUF2637 domain-containing protein n=1 Tax=Rugosimonospora africana TaxID=556532 RepID=A0A8J3QWN7_9ACTN|nr:hypothetical protein [Rugosimonospora africana]GIH18780.1 hypothetical protein Raf01_69520 [Rugosimonospora africana]
MTGIPNHAPPGRRSDMPVAETEMDAHLQRTVRRTSVMRQGFYFVVLIVALAGQVSGAVETLGIPLAAAVPAVAALELGGIVVLANADVRRRLGERAVASRLLSVAIAAGAVAFNWLAHANHLLGGFFAGMSALGYLVWLMHTENQRRDRLRAKGDLPPTTPAYEVVEHWLRHPWLTHRAKSMAKADPRLGLYDSLTAARAEVRRERRQAAISKVLHRKIRGAVDPNTADIAIAVYDLDEIATRLAEGADYDGLTALIAADLAPARLGLDSGALPAPAAPVRPAQAQPAPEAAATTATAPAIDAPPATDAPVLDDALALDDAPAPAGNARAIDSPTIESPVIGPQARAVARVEPGTVFDSSLYRSLEELGLGRQSEPGSGPSEEPARRERTRRSTGSQRGSAPVRTAPAADAPALEGAPAAPVTGPLADTLPPPSESTGGRARREGALRSLVHGTLDRHVQAGDERDESSLVELVADVLDLDDLDRITAATYVQSWNREGSRVAVPARNGSA